MVIREKLEKIDYIGLIIGLIAVLSGGFFEWTSAVASVLLAAVLIIKTIKTQTLTIKINWVSVAVATLVIFYGLSCIWAVDRGMAFVGFLKFLPLVLLGFILAQGRAVKLDFLPYLAAGITAISTLLAQFGLFENYLLVSGRLAGTFQYPNTFALFLIVAELLLIYDFKPKWYNLLTLGVLLFGIFYTGSRTGFIIAAAFNLWAILRIKRKALRWGVLGGIVAAVAVVALVGVLLGGTDTFARFLTISFKESTFLGRFLYFRDALPVILKHPLGLGYMGYYYLQPTFQTGVYSVTYAHNDLLQIAVDVGWLPLILFVGAIVKSLLSKNIPLVNKWLIAAIILHSCFDFNLQFCSIGLILLCLMDYSGGKEIELTQKRVTAIAVSALCGGLSLYFGFAMFSAFLGNHQLSHSLFSGYTYNNLRMLSNEKDVTTAAEIAEEILEDNQYAVSAYDALSMAAYSQGDVEEVISLRNQILTIYPLGYEEYKEYCEMLINISRVYRNSGDINSAEYCENELVFVKNSLEENGAKVSPLGKMISDKFETQLPQEIIAYIEMVS